jgi:hypothetical protein
MYRECKFPSAGGEIAAVHPRLGTPPEDFFASPCFARVIRTAARRSRANEACPGAAAGATGGAEVVAAIEARSGEAEFGCADPESPDDVRALANRAAHLDSLVP